MEVCLGVGELFMCQEGGVLEKIWIVGGLMIQFLLELLECMCQLDFDFGDVLVGIVLYEFEEDDVWVEVKVFVDMIKDVELIDLEVSVEMLLF